MALTTQKVLGCKKVQILNAHEKNSNFCYVLRERGGDLEVVIGFLLVIIFWTV